MDKHASLLIMTYLGGLLLGVVLALTASQTLPGFYEPWHCQNSACHLLPDITMMLAITVIVGALLAFTSLLLSRGLYRLFSTENKPL